MEMRLWYEKRQAHVKKSGRLQPAKDSSCLRSVPELDQFVLASCEPLAVQYGLQLDADPVQGMLTFLTRQDARDKVKDLTKSDIIFRLVSQSIQRSWMNVIAKARHTSASDLEKAVDPKSWKRVAGAHNDNHSEIVDHSFHLREKPAPQAYAEVLGNPKHKMKPVKINNGITAKMVHEAPEGKAHDGSLMGNAIIMAKPYHKNIESATRSWVKHPITGWATMATKGLFDASGIGHLAEDVYAHQHEGVPLTVHKFAPNMREVSDANSSNELHNYTIDPNDTMKIGVMDFLTNNLDRHMGNLLVSSDPGDTDERGYNKIMAIDHERNFQYDKTSKTHHAWATPRRYEGGNQPRWQDRELGLRASRKDNENIEAPNDYMEHGRATGSILNIPHNKPHYLGDLAEWWHKHSPNVKQEFLRHLGAVQDEGLRRHLHDNFMNRASYMDNWAKNGLESDELYELNELDSVDREGKPRGVSNSKLHALPVSTGRRMVDKADLSKPGPTLDGLAKWVTHYKASSKHWNAAQQLLGHVVEKMTPEQLVQGYQHMSANPMYASRLLTDRWFPMKKQFLARIRDEASPDKKRAMIQHLESTGDDHDAMWARELRGILGEA